MCRTNRRAATSAKGWGMGVVRQEADFEGPEPDTWVQAVGCPPPWAARGSDFAL